MSNQRGLVQRIERRLENTVGDAFARVFGGSIVPAEVEAALRREASAGVQALPRERFLAPNEYVITLSASDFEKVSADRDLTTDTFAKHLGGYIRDQGWQTYGDVVVRFEQSPSLHTGQYRARGVVNPDVDPHPSRANTAPPQSNQAYTAEPGVPAMSDNPTYRGDQGQGRPGDDYYDDRYPRPEEPRAGAPEQRGPYPPEQGGYAPPPGEQGYGQRPGYPEQGGYGGQGYGQGYEQRPPAGGGYGGPGYDQGYRQGPPPGYGAPSYGPPQGGGYAPAAPPSSDYDYGRGPGRHEDAGYGRPEPRPAYPDQGGYDQGYGQQGGYGRPDYGQPDYGQPDYGQPAGRGYEQGGYAEPAGRDYDYGQPAGGGYGGYAQPPAQGDYPSTGHAVTLQLDDGSGRTYQLREGANVIGRGQDAQFRLPDTGVSRRHLEIRWDGQVALLSDLNSTNGTTVNNAPVQEWQLADGDVIRLGHSEIIVRVH
ncbi:FhaA domain-containing protein [Mycobacterium sp. shizuoka-1]|uniref:FhaA domain-containing protein n=1 Tax=Mycobacterium sp. shizuoka-1 TaxID=2039281 RepID=UPI000C062EA3|nr:FhaA domain-containing protein [Mycobacterium sp. shizuoka-1]GAY13982.1 phosphopeptide-binding protein [Mycobacterium sp. shizuoka-1]